MVVRSITHETIRGEHALRAKPIPETRMPRLENGDRLTRPEFEMRYRAMPHIKKAELVEGVVYMPSPVHFAQHGKPHQIINGWLITYCASTPGVETADNVSVRLDAENEVQPDALLRLIEGGTSQVTPDDFLTGAPELIVEIASTSAAYDLHDKKRVYRRNGVREYIVWQVHEVRVSWFVLREGEYRELAPDNKGVMHSAQFPGLRLNVNAMLKGDLAEVLAELRRGLKSAEHTNWAKRSARAVRR
ncbi:MAG: Uma2 family endonuclease [Chloroflexi bacterium]|nr:Uma2 family endonuclease [Chloroflexota bacterium]